MAATFWSQLPDAPDSAFTRSLLGHLGDRVAIERSVPAPAVFADADRRDDLAGLVDALPSDECTPDLLGLVYERLMASPQRRVRGAHFTPVGVADSVVGCAVDQLSDLNVADLTVWDPTAGGGAFLLAAARRIELETGRSRSEVVEGLYASDIDPIAIEVCSATLELWCGGSARPVTYVGDTLLDLPATWPATFDLIVGNPPFLGQLTSDTARDTNRRERLRAEFAAVAGGYVDESGLFLHLALSRKGPSGVVALLLPESMLAARDAKCLRVESDRLAPMVALWIDEEQSFEASVDVVAPVFGSCEGTPPGVVTVTSASISVKVPRPDVGVWSPLLAAARGVPGVRVVSSVGVLGDLATVTAGFRQHFYGLVGAVGEAKAPRDWSGGELRLVTAGAIDPLHLLWGTGSVKFAGTKWDGPVVTLAAIGDDSVRRWFTNRCVPKILLATQTKVLEAVVDTDGVLLPSVPALSVEPRDVDDLWLLAAVLTSPWASAWLASRAAGSGLSVNAFRVRAKEVSALPLPGDREAWVRGGLLAAEAQEASSRGDAASYSAAMRQLGEAMVAAYGDDDDSVLDWWWGRLGMPEGSEVRAY